jgi:hypothetical protein
LRADWTDEIREQGREWLRQAEETAHLTAPRVQVQVHLLTGDPRQCLLLLAVDAWGDLGKGESWLIKVSRMTFEDIEAVEHQTLAEQLAGWQDNTPECRSKLGSSCPARKYDSWS